VRRLGVLPVVSRGQAEHGCGRGMLRWFVERTISRLHAFGRLPRRLDRLTQVQDALLPLACASVCLNLPNP
jgi:hypothetical protein